MNQSHILMILFGVVIGIIVCAADERRILVSFVKDKAFDLRAFIKRKLARRG